MASPQPTVIEVLEAFLRKIPRDVIVPCKTDGEILVSYGVVIARWNGNDLIIPELSSAVKRSCKRQQRMIRVMATERKLIDL